MLGTNDAQNGYNEEEDHPDEYNDVFALRQYFQEDYRGLLKKVRDARPGAEVFSVKPPPIMDSIWRKHKQEYLEDILNRLDEIWKTESYLHGIDVQGAFLKLRWEERRKLYQADGCHPNGLGAELIARTVAESVRRLTANP